MSSPSSPTASSTCDIQIRRSTILGSSMEAVASLGGGTTISRAAVSTKSRGRSPRLPTAKDKNLTPKSDIRTPFPISCMHRAMSDNCYEYHLHCATRSCYSCSECKQGRYTHCASSEADKKSGADWLQGRCSHELKEVVVQPRTTQKDQYSHTALQDLGNSVFNDAAVGDVLAMESQTDLCSSR